MLCWLVSSVPGAPDHGARGVTERVRIPWVPRRGATPDERRAPKALATIRGGMPMTPWSPEAEESLLELRVADPEYREVCLWCQGKPDHCNRHLLPPWQCEDCTLTRGAICGCSSPRDRLRALRD